jgi:carbon storage regulator CsrA
MLVLSRKTQESVVIVGADGLHQMMKVTVLSIQGHNVRLGFEVDADVPVHRAEVWERICVERQTESRLEGVALPAVVV